MNGSDPRAEVQRYGRFVPAANGDRVDAGSELRTYDPGRLSLFLYDERVPIAGRAQRLGPNTQLLVESLSDTVLSVVIKRGWFNAVGPTAARSGNAHAESTGTEFVMSYDPDNAITDVVCIVGTVRVRNRRGGKIVPLKNREMTRVIGRQAPTEPRAIDDAELLRYVSLFELIGGGKEQSQSTNHSILNGNSVPPPDRLVTRIPSVIEEEPPRLIEVFTQPPAVVELTDLRVDF